MHFALVSAHFFYHRLLHVLYDSYSLNITKERVSTKKKNEKKDEKNVLNAKTVHFTIVSAHFFNRRLLHMLYDSHSLNNTKERVSKKNKKKGEKNRPSAQTVYFTLVWDRFFYRRLLHVLYGSQSLNNTKKKELVQKKNKKKHEKTNQMSKSLLKCSHIGW